MAQVSRGYSPRPCRHRYNSERAVRWPDANAWNKAATMRSSLTSSSQVNRASRGRGRGEHPDRVETRPCRGWTYRVFTKTEDRWPNFPTVQKPIQAIQKLSGRTRARLIRAASFLLYFFYILTLFFILTDKSKAHVVCISKILKGSSCYF